MVLEDSKATLRQEALARRDALLPQERVAAAETIANRPLPFTVRPGMVVSAFLPIKTEINPLPLLRKLAAAGAKLALPVISGRGKPLAMRAYAFGDALAPGQWGIREPLPSAREVDPDVLLVPLACFDRRGHRIGYGAGYFDLTITRLRAIKPIIAAGIAFASQEVARVPETDRDARLDLVLTERETIDLRTSS
ncbi:MAG: 5-formyltetrahydrofolate cyclo-ligase [Pseudolabrys sp.]|nr:5-formyltetrahydrofolate cyclo-ligase [Pseudolabrys sp.]